MEDKDTKTVQMPQAPKQEQQPTYEELKMATQELIERNKELVNALQENHVEAMIKRLSFLIELCKIINGNGDYKFSDEFCHKVFEEIEYGMYPVKKKEEERKDEPKAN
jgi:hypothetical protein